MSKIDFITKRYSSRNFKDEAIKKSDLNLLMKAANSSPTSNNFLDSSAIFITDKKLKREIYNLSKFPDQEHIYKNAVLVVFVADQNRLRRAIKNYYDKEISMSIEKLEMNNLNNFMIAFGDAFIMAQTTLLAAQELGYQTCYLGGFRYFGISKFLKESLNLPNHVSPIVGLAIGKDKFDTLTKEHINRCFINSYNQEQIDYENEIESISINYENKETDYVKNAIRGLKRDYTSDFIDDIKEWLK
ncbi:nitroreductase [Mycoplasma testudineum]|uniref:Nitroreductase n=1 Tax=Mycoplasma testudineum TaxID=244584 RepID=A0A4R6IBQ0_9MOLU|nr:nitroreductase family protein [Mycoplasma testudineum]TDO18967.1 nitroreductase [Mycoplasma testudineum]